MNRTRREVLKKTATFAFAGVAADAAAQDLTFVAERELETAVRALVRLEIARSGAVQGRESAGMTDAFVKQGVTRFVADGGLKDDPAISRVLESSRVLGRELARAASNNRIGESTLPSIRPRICPLYPFC